MLPMRNCLPIVFAGLLLYLAPVANAQSSPPKPAASKSQGDASARKDSDPEIELQKAVASAGNDRAALVRNLKDYLQRFPDAPRKASVDRAIIEACQQLRDNACALEYAERLIVERPDDSEIMMLAVDLLQQQGDDASLTRAVGYVTRVLDRVEKSPVDEKSARSSVSDWQSEREQLRSELYFVRARIENLQKHYDTAGKDLQRSYSIHPNAPAAELLGELAEIHNDPAKAIDEYSLAFVLPLGSSATKIDRHDIRMKLGNVWKQVYGTENGLGAQILATYDKLSANPVSADPAARNKDAKDPFAFVLRRMDGSPFAFSPFKGKVVVLSFWATWCGPCRELEPMFNQLAINFESNSDIAFVAVSTDNDESLVPPFVAQQKWNVPVVFADGLNDFMGVTTLPTVLILDRNGKIVYRTNGLGTNFSESLTAAIRAALNSSK
jgi:thiol-disulfide isomerase/thioredoxin